MPCSRASFINCKSVTLITSQCSIQAVILPCHVFYVHGGKKLGFVICKLSVRCLTVLYNINVTSVYFSYMYSVYLTGFATRTCLQKMSLFGEQKCQGVFYKLIRHKIPTKEERKGERRQKKERKGGKKRKKEQRTGIPDFIVGKP